MTNAERKALVERMALAICNNDCADADFPPYEPDMKRFRDVSGYRRYMQRARAALAVAEPVVREDEREACAKVADETPEPYNIYRWPDAISDAIRARGAA